MIMSKSDADKIAFILNKHEQANGINAKWHLNRSWFGI